MMAHRKRLRFNSITLDSLCLQPSCPLIQISKRKLALLVEASENLSLRTRRSFLGPTIERQAHFSVRKANQSHIREPKFHCIALLRLIRPHHNIQNHQRSPYASCRFIRIASGLVHSQLVLLIKLQFYILKRGVTKGLSRPKKLIKVLLWVLRRSSAMGIRLLEVHRHSIGRFSQLQLRNTIIILMIKMVPARPVFKTNRIPYPKEGSRNQEVKRFKLQAPVQSSLAPL